ncbi:MAG: molybdopterin-dependent oxidoreductase [Haloarculaceae archaeon]
MLTNTKRVTRGLPTIVLALFAGGAAVVGSYAASGYTPSFVVAPVAALVAATTPDVVIRYAITVLGDLGEQLHLVAAVALSIGGIGAVAAASIALGRRLHNRALPVILTTAGTWIVVVALTGDPGSATAGAASAGAVVLVAAVVPALPVGTDVDPARRRVLAGGLAFLGLGAVGYALARRRPAATDELGADSPGTSPARRQALLDEAAAKSLDVPGLEPLVSEEFYQVDVNAVDPSVEAASWSLSVTGAVDEAVTVDYEQLRAMDATDRFETLRCVGESLNGKKMDTALWTGVPATDVLERAGPHSDCGCVMLRAADGYFEEFPLAALDDALLAYGMNGRELPRAHGHPVRVLVPGHWGEINVKWVTELEVLEREATGYWEKRGWHGTGPVRTVAKLHAVGQRRDGSDVVGGHAYAGTRGIDRVEVSTDGGATWDDAELSDPIPGIDVWRQWRYAFDHRGGDAEVVVRAIDGTGRRQPRAESGAFPNGPSGWVSKTI